MSCSQNLHELSTQVSQLCSIDKGILANMAREAAQLDVSWSLEYSEYQSGGWKTLSLYNQTRDPHDVIITDGIGRETSLLATMPTTRKYLKELNLQYMSVRLAKLEPKAFLWEHRDYLELEERKRLRLHIPLITNPESRLVIGEASIHMGHGYIWMLNPTERHGACNLGHQARIHLLIDIYLDKVADELMRVRSLDSAHVKLLATPMEGQMQRAVQMAKQLAELGYFSSADNFLLKLFHQFNLNEGEAYDLIITMYEQLHDFVRQQLWQARRGRFLERNIYGSPVTRKPAIAK